MADELAAALQDAFRTRIDLSRMIWYKTSRNLEDYAGPGGLDSVVFELLSHADANGWLLELVDGALRQNPRSPPLREFYNRYHVALTAPSSARLQSTIKPKVPSFDFEPWVSWLIETGHRVCAVRVPTRPTSKAGTGFLIGPDLVMTAYHVLEELLPDKSASVRALDPAAVSFVFDYTVLSDGVTINPGVSYRIRGSVPDWLVFSSPGSPYDENLEAVGNIPSPNELDFVIVKVDSPPEFQARGWISLDVDEADLRPHDPLMILHHPAKSPLRFAVDSDSVVSVNENRTRVRYRLNTRGGSSGAPCFDARQNLIAIHQRGDDLRLDANQGVPIDAVAAMLRTANFKFWP